MAAPSKMAARERSGRMDGDAVLATYARWLKRQPLAERSRDAYLAQVRGFIGWLAGSEHGPQALIDTHVRDWAVRDYKRHVKTARRWAPASVNQALAAIDNFYRSLAAGPPEVLREELAQVAPRALERRRPSTLCLGCRSVGGAPRVTSFLRSGAVRTVTSQNPPSRRTLSHWSHSCGEMSRRWSLPPPFYWGALLVVCDY